MDNDPDPRQRRQGIYGAEFQPILARGLSVDSNEYERRATSYFLRDSQQDLKQQGASNTVPCGAQEEAATLFGSEPGPTLRRQETKQDIYQEEPTAAVPCLADLIPALRRAASSASSHSSFYGSQDLAPRRARAYTELIGNPFSGSDTSSLLLVHRELGLSTRSRVSQWSFEKRTESPHPSIDPFPTYQESESEEWYSGDPGNKDLDRSLIPSLKVHLRSSASCHISEKRISKSYRAGPNPKRGLRLPLGHRPLRLPVEEQKYSREPLRINARRDRRIAERWARDRARERSNTAYNPAGLGLVLPRQFDPSIPSTSASSKPSRNPFLPAGLPGLPVSSSPFTQSSDLPFRSPNVASQQKSYFPHEFTSSSPLDLPPQRHRATRRTLPREASSSNKDNAKRRPTEQRRPTLLPSVTPPYPAYTFETRSERRRFDPLNFYPVDSNTNGYVDSLNPSRVLDDTFGRARETSGGSNTTPSLRQDSSRSSDFNFDSVKPKRKRKEKKRGSSGLASSIRKFFRSSSKQSSEEGTSAADIALFLAPQEVAPLQTVAPKYSTDPAPVHVVKNRRPALPNFTFPLLASGTELPSSFATGLLATPPIPTFPPENSPLTRRFPVSASPDSCTVTRPSELTLPPPWSTKMDPSRASRFLDPSSAMVAITKQKAEAMKLAREQAAAVKEMCRRAKTDVPPYEFEELIGKGAYGRVYKGRQLPNRQLVAIKVMEIDTLDYKSIRDMKDESIKDFIHETRVMKQVKDAGAKNINMLIEAISIHSQLWLVCEYCPGGSVKTLMRATGDKLGEKFIIPIARELAEGLRAIHDAGIIHRDVKAANILIHEEGRLQICDFGVAGVLQSKLDKRSTWIGTPHWMPPEMFSTRGGGAHQYGSEIDVWAFGCTLFEFAMGNPPNAGLRERMQIGRQLTRLTPKLEGEEFSDQLKDLVSFALNSDPMTRPAMGDILAHPYIADSVDTYPTSSLSELVRIYYQWAQRGGQRISLFNPGGAVAAEFPGENDSLPEDWNFSTTDGFEKRYSIIDLDQLSASLADLEGEITPAANQPERDLFDDPPSTEYSAEEKANFDERVKRGAAAMEGLFNEDRPTYKYETKNDFVPVEQKQRYSDLPLRTDTDRSSVTSTFIDINLGAFDSAHYAAGSAANHPFQLADADTIRANRSSGRLHRNSNEEHSRSRFSDTGSSDSQEAASYQPQTGPRPPTMDWTFPTFMQPSEEDIQDQQDTQQEIDTQTEKRATMDWSFPVMTAEDNDQATGAIEADSRREDTIRAPLQQPPTSRPRGTHESIDESRPSTATSTVSNASEADYDPFRFDRPSPPQGGASTQNGQFSDNDFPTMMDSNGHSDYEPSSVLDGPGPDEEESHPAWQANAAVTDPSYVEPFPSALFSNQPEVSSPTAATIPSLRPQPATARGTTSTRNIVPPISFPDIQPPSFESLTEGADDAVVAAELDRLLGDFLSALSATGEALATVDTEPTTRDKNATSKRDKPE